MAAICRSENDSPSRAGHCIFVGVLSMLLQREDIDFVLDTKQLEFTQFDFFGFPFLSQRIHVEAAKAAKSLTQAIGHWDIRLCLLDKTLRKRHFARVLLNFAEPPPRFGALFLDLPTRNDKCKNDYPLIERWERELLSAAVVMHRSGATAAQGTDHRTQPNSRRVLTQVVTPQKIRKVFWNSAGAL